MFRSTTVFSKTCLVFSEELFCYSVPQYVHQNFVFAFFHSVSKCHSGLPLHYYSITATKSNSWTDAARANCRSKPTSLNILICLVLFYRLSLSFSFIFISNIHFFSLALFSLPLCPLSSLFQLSLCYIKYFLGTTSTPIILCKLDWQLQQELSQLQDQLAQQSLFAFSLSPTSEPPCS